MIVGIREKPHLMKIYKAWLSSPNRIKASIIAKQFKFTGNLFLPLQQNQGNDVPSLGELHSGRETCDAAAYDQHLAHFIKG